RICTVSNKVNCAFTWKPAPAQFAFSPRKPYRRGAPATRRHTLARPWSSTPSVRWRQQSEKDRGRENAGRAQIWVRIFSNSGGARRQVQCAPKEIAANAQLTHFAKCCVRDCV